jgi:hypothetical protein
VQADGAGMPYLRAAGLFACALVLAGCALGKEGGPQEITPEQLAVMVLPREALGAEYATFAADDDSGPGTAKDMAEGTFDPDDTAAAVKQSGWTRGYDLSYSTQKRLAAEGRPGAVSAGTSADLFATETDARSFILAEIRQFRRFEGKNRKGVKILRADEFDVIVGDESWGVELEFRGSGAALTMTGVIFRHGRLVATAFYLRGDGADVRPQAASSALKLENRIERVLAGDLEAKPVPLPAGKRAVSKAQLARMTLGLEDLPAGARVDAEGRAPSGGGAVSYFRLFDVQDTMIGGSHLMVVRAQTQVFETEAAAESMLRFLETPKGRRYFARAVLRSFGDLAGARARNVEIQALDGGRGAPGIVVTFDMPGGRFKTATVFVRSGRSVATISGFCTAHAVHPGDLPPLGKKAQARLASIPV